MQTSPSPRQVATDELLALASKEARALAAIVDEYVVPQPDWSVAFTPEQEAEILERIAKHLARRADLSTLTKVIRGFSLVSRPDPTLVGDLMTIIAPHMRLTKVALGVAEPAGRA